MFNFDMGTDMGMYVFVADLILFVTLKLTNNCETYIKDYTHMYVNSRATTPTSKLQETNFSPNAFSIPDQYAPNFSGRGNMFYSYSISSNATAFCVCLFSKAETSDGLDHKSLGFPEWLDTSLNETEEKKLTRHLPLKNKRQQPKTEVL